MPWLDKIKRTPFFIKLRSWEYWPFGIVQFPIFFYYPWLALRAKSLTFFAGSNPGILMGGMFGESKFDVLKLIPKSLIPKSFLLHEGSSVKQLLSKLEEYEMSFPLIFKPDVGERGFMVKRIRTVDEATAYLSRMKYDFIIQELVDLPLEFGVFYVRRPMQENGRVISIVMKEMLSVVGDGRSTLQELIMRNERALLQWPVLRETHASDLNKILKVGERREIVSIGNHCLGTKFINANHLITPKLSASFDRISQQISGFYFGRFDLRCASLDDLENGNVKILELNGCGAEPAHIYDPSFSFWKAVATLIEHWKTIFIIAEENKARGVRNLSLNEAIGHYRNFRQKTRPS